MSNNLVFNISLTDRAIEKGIRLPKELSSDLAYICGVLAGDGSISIEERDNKIKYSLTYTGNALDEKEFYHKVIGPKFKNVFGIIPNIKHNKRDNTYEFRLNSKPIVLFLTEVIGLPKGKKYDFLKIPKLLKDKNLIINFIRGIFDTDGCMTFKKRYRDYPYYPAIIFSSKSKAITKEIANFLIRLGFKIVQIYDYKVIDERFKAGFNLINRIEMNGRKNLDKWIKLINFYNPKHLGKIKKFYIKL